MKTMHGIIQDILLYKDSLIFATFEGKFSDDSNNRNFASVIYKLQTEDLTGLLSAPSVLVVRM